MSSRLRIIVSGLIAQYPVGGMAWHYIQYALGLARLGHDVYYLEDTRQWPYNPVERRLGKDCSYNVDYLARGMARFGLADKWAYCFDWQSQWFGLSDVERMAVIDSADLLINISGTLARPEAYQKVRRLVYVDTDPVFTQIKLARGQADFRNAVDAHDAHFSFGETLPGAAPLTGHQWRPTRQPIVLSEWQPRASHRDAFTTVMNWTSYKPITYCGQSYGQKDIEFERFLDLPSWVGPTVLELAVGPGKTRRTPRELLAHKGWHLADPNKVCPDIEGYRGYIESSKAEWSVAKNGYVVGQAGWFSERSACYLAAGKPIVVQDTGFAAVLPVGEGILTFRTVEEAASAIREVEENYARHAKAASGIAEEYFDSDKVLRRLIDDAFATPPGSCPTRQESTGEALA